MTAENILDTINEIILEENGSVVGIDSYLLDSDMDSFAYAVFWFKVDDEFPNCFDKEYIQKIDYVSYTVKELIDRIIK